MEVRLEVRRVHFTHRVDILVFNLVGSLPAVAQQKLKADLPLQQRILGQLIDTKEWNKEMMKKRRRGESDGLVSVLTPKRMTCSHRRSYDGRENEHDEEQNK